MKKTKSKRKIILSILLVILLLLLLAAGAIYAVVKSFYHASNYTPDEDAMNQFTELPEDSDGNEIYEDTEEIEPEDSQGEILTDEELNQLEQEKQEVVEIEPVTNDGNVYNVLLIGVDRRNGSWAGNSDSMILMSLNYDKKQISMISLMRDTYVDIPGIGMRKLNAAHANGGGPLLVKTVTENFKVQVERYATVDFNSMIDIIDLVGGIELTITEKEVKWANYYITEMCDLRGLDPEEYLIQEGGTYHCSGIQAVAYARIRYVGNADYQRTERQRTVLTKIAEKLKSLSLTELYNFANAALPLVTHNIPEDEMWKLLSMAPTLFQYDLVKDRIPYDKMYKIIYVNKQDMLVPNWKKTIARLKETLY